MTRDDRSRFPSGDRQNPDYPLALPGALRYYVTLAARLLLEGALVSYISIISPVHPSQVHAQASGPDRNQKEKKMADNAPGGAAEAAPAPVITQGQTTSVGENTQTVQEVQPEGAVAEETRQPSIWDNWLLYAVAALWIWYLFGNKKRKNAKAAEKKERERRDTLQKGDNIVTIGRMHGKVVAFTDQSVTIKPDPKAEYTMTFDRQAIYRVLPRPGEEPEEQPQEKK